MQILFYMHLVRPRNHYYMIKMKAILDVASLTPGNLIDLLIEKINGPYIILIHSSIKKINHPYFIKIHSPM